MVQFIHSSPLILWRMTWFMHQSTQALFWDWLDLIVVIAKLLQVIRQLAAHQWKTIVIILIVQKATSADTWLKDRLRNHQGSHKQSSLLPSSFVSLLPTLPFSPALLTITSSSWASLPSSPLSLSSGSVQCTQPYPAECRLSPAPLPRVFVRWSVRQFSIGAKCMLGHVTSPPPVCVCVFSLLPCDVCGAVTFFVRAPLGELSNNKVCV